MTGAIAMPEQPWGRIADDGTVFVRTAEGERAVGSWLAGAPSDGLAFYARRYETLGIDITLLGQRIKDGHLTADDALAKIGKYRQQVDEPQCVGDLDALRRQLDDLVAVVSEQRGKRTAAREEARRRARELRESIVTEAEQLAESTQWKAAGDRYRELVEQWKQAPHIDRPSEQELWHRLSHARSSFDRRRRAHFAEVESHREAAAVQKRAIVTEAEQLAASTEWGPTSGRFRDLMRRWKAAGPAPRETEAELWERFRQAQDAFFTARNAANAEREGTYRDNLSAKQALAAEAEALLPPTDLRSARNALRSIQDRWAAVGPVSRQDRDAVEGRLRHVEQVLRDAEQNEWRRTNPEARARAEDAVTQLEAAIARLEDDLAQAFAQGQPDRVAEAEAALAARREWLAEAQKALAEFSG